MVSWASVLAGLKACQSCAALTVPTQEKYGNLEYVGVIVAGKGINTNGVTINECVRVCMYVYITRINQLKICCSPPSANTTIMM